MNIHTYLLNHWQGNHSLAKSFWINTAPFIVIFLFIFNLLFQINSVIIQVRLNLLLFIVTYIAILPWQIVGIVRCIVRHIKHQKKVIFPVLIIFFLLLELTFFSWFLFRSQQNLIDGVYVSVDYFNKGDYEVSLDEFYENTILVKGEFDLGISNELERVLKINPQTKTIAFDSNGGLDFEARKLFSIIKEKGLNTYIPEYCASACITAFIGGEKRQMSSKAMLGFHQFSNAFNTKEYTENQLKDTLYDTIKFYKQQGIDKEFVKRFFKTPPEEMWYPRNEELLKQGVVTEVLDD